jgi:predicted GNAT family acetyltransferase
VDIAAFNALHMPALERDEAKHSLILVLMARAALEDPPGQTRFWSLGEPGACAVQTPKRGLVLGAPRREHCEAFAEAMAGTHFRSVMGPDTTAEWFVARAEALGETFDEPWSQRIMALSGAPIRPQVVGEPRLMTAADADFYEGWALAFHQEALPGDPPPERSDLERQAASGSSLFWTVDGAPVSMAGLMRRTRDCCSIGAVYTPPALRGCGYAGAVTAAAVDMIYAEGRKTACLYADMANPFSNRCYEKIGFREICRSAMFRQTTPGVGDNAE